MTVKTAISNLLRSEPPGALSPLARPPVNTYIFFFLLTSKRSVISVISIESPVKMGLGCMTVDLDFTVIAPSSPLALL